MWNMALDSLRGLGVYNPRVPSREERYEPLFSLSWARWNPKKVTPS